MALELAGRIDLTFVDGSGLLIGSWVYMATWGVLVTQFIKYVTMWTKDSIFLRSTIVFLCLCETMSTMLALQATFYQLVTVTPGSLESLIPPLSFVCLPFLNSATILICNVLLVWRYDKLTKRRWISLALLIVILAAHACFTWSIVLSVKLRNTWMDDMDNLINSFHQAARASRAGMYLEIITVCTIWILMSTHLFALLLRDMQGTRKILTRLFFATVESGSVSSALAITVFAVYCQTPNSSNVLVLAGCMSRVYCMGVLFSLNVRSSGGQVMSNNPSARVSSYSGSKALGSISVSTHSATKDDIRLPDIVHLPHSQNDIHVTQMTEIEVDDESPDERKQKEKEKQSLGQSLV